MSEDRSAHVAVLGMAGRFPGAADLGEFWRNLVEGRQSIQHFSREELLAGGVPAARADHPDYVPARGFLEDAECFDAAFFGMSPAMAASTDPQHRLLLECAWAALEDAAIDPSRVGRDLGGVFAGCTATGWASAASSGLFGLAADLANENDHLATRVAYKLDLRGPALTVQTACSTSLVAIVLAWQSLVSWQCDFALAGGVCVGIPRVDGHIYMDGDIYSPDGRTLSYDARAAGTVAGDGVGMVVLRRLEDALERGDPIRAILRGAAMNNDGARKVGYTAPSVQGQADCILQALRVADVSADRVGMVEGHGTATPMGDPVEVAALCQAFSESASRDIPPASCALGSVKSNIGHLAAAAGVAGFIKTVLALENGFIPQLPTFEQPNPAADFGPLFVPRRTMPFPQDRPLACVSAFGAGGTNAHVVLERAPTRPPSFGDDPAGTVLLSAHDPAALNRRILSLQAVDAPLSDICRTLREGRRWMACRAAGVGDSLVEILPRLYRGRVPKCGRRDVVWLLPGQGVQVPGAAMAWVGLPAFSRALDHCCDLFVDQLGVDPRDDLLGEQPRSGADDQHRAGAALFALGWAMGAAWMDFGARPQAIIGQSTGEYVAAALAGVYSLEDAVTLFSARTRLFDQAPPGGLLSVALSPSQLQLDGALRIAVHSAPSITVVSGPPDDLDALQARLQGRGILARRLRVSVPAHHPLLKGLAPGLRQAADRVSCRPARIPLYACATASLVDTLRPEHWVEHMLRPVRFAETLALAASSEDAAPCPAFVELGPGGCLDALVQATIPSAPVVRGIEAASVPAELLQRDRLAALWVHGVDVEDTALCGPLLGRRSSLPTYPFARTRHWPDRLEPARENLAPPQGPRSPEPLRAESVLSIARELLGLPELSARDDLLEHGGDSLFRLRLAAAIRDQLGVTIPTQEVLRASTVASLSKRIPPTSVGRCVVPLARGVGPPIFLVHPAAGVVFPFLALARRLSVCGPVYGLQAAGVDGVDLPDRKVEQMAQRYARSMLPILGTQPLRIIGYSFGAYVAFELASRLDPDGTRTNLLALVDEPAPLPDYRPRLREVASLWGGPGGRSFIRHLRDYLRLGGGRSVGIQGILLRASVAGVMPVEAQELGIDEATLRVLARLLRLHIAETFRYTAKPWAGQGVVYRSEWTEHWRPTTRGDAAMGWGQILSKVDVACLSGDHLGLLREPHVAILADDILQRLRQPAALGGR